ncbi:MAG: hypothetical protein PQJ48_04910 [Sphaerochaetaceae bacterium]|nr:hypothetical protein [Sphaerochaetaceae bacterium]
MGRRSKVVLSIVAIIVVVLLVLLLPPSVLQKRFAGIEQEFVQNLESKEEVFTLEELEGYPLPVQRFYTEGGFIGKQKMSGLKAVFSDVPFSLGRDKPAISIDYTQINDASEPLRFAYINSHIYGLPFQGLDSFSGGRGSMEGYLAKRIRLFNQRGGHMDKACLVTYLAEAFFLPTVALSDMVSWEAIDETHAKATMKAYGMEVSGIFTFSETGEMLVFSTEDRMAASMDGSLEQVPWSAECGEYVIQDGMRVPTRLKATWHYPQGDLLYFDGTGVQITYYY